MRSSTGSIPEAIASSSIAHSSAYMPGHSPGARIQDGVGTSSRTSLWLVSRLGAAYIMRVTTAVCSANSLSVELCSHTSWEIALSLPAESQPRRMRWIVGVR
jgi:hypothetical protein